MNPARDCVEGQRALNSQESIWQTVCSLPHLARPRSRPRADRANYGMRAGAAGRGQDHLLAKSQLLACSITNIPSNHVSGVGSHHLIATFADWRDAGNAKNS
jgi:hypothetical protein